MNLQELGTLAQYDIAAKTLIINNGWQGMVRQWQQTFFQENYMASNMEVGMPDIELLCRSYGLKGAKVEDRADLEAAIAEMLAWEGPYVLDVRVVKDENCYPMIAPGKSNAQMMGLPQMPEKSDDRLFCPSCGEENPDSHQYCSACGTKL